MVRQAEILLAWAAMDADVLPAHRSTLDPPPGSDLTRAGADPGQQEAHAERAEDEGDHAPGQRTSRKEHQRQDGERAQGNGGQRETVAREPFPLGNLPGEGLAERAAFLLFPPCVREVLVPRAGAGLPRDGPPPRGDGPRGRC